MATGRSPFARSPFPALLDEEDLSVGAVLADIEDKIEPHLTTAAEGNQDLEVDLIGSIDFSKGQASQGHFDEAERELLQRSLNADQLLSPTHSGGARYPPFRSGVYQPGPGEARLDAKDGGPARVGLGASSRDEVPRSHPAAEAQPPVGVRPAEPEAADRRDGGAGPPPPPLAPPEESLALSDTAGTLSAGAQPLAPRPAVAASDAPPAKPATAASDAPAAKPVTAARGAPPAEPATAASEAPPAKPATAASEAPPAKPAAAASDAPPAKPAAAAAATGGEALAMEARLKETDQKVADLEKKLKAVMDCLASGLDDEKAEQSAAPSLDRRLRKLKEEIENVSRTLAENLDHVVEGSVGTAVAAYLEEHGAAPVAPVALSEVSGPVPGDIEKRLEGKFDLLCRDLSARLDALGQRADADVPRCEGRATAAARQAQEAQDAAAQLKAGVDGSRELSEANARKLSQAQADLRQLEQQVQDLGRRQIEGARARDLQDVSSAVRGQVDSVQERLERLTKDCLQAQRAADDVRSDLQTEAGKLRAESRQQAEETERRWEQARRPEQQLEQLRQELHGLTEKLQTVVSEGARREQRTLEVDARLGELAEARDTAEQRLEQRLEQGLHQRFAEVEESLSSSLGRDGRVLQQAIEAASTSAAAVADLKQRLVSLEAALADENRDHRGQIGALQEKLTSALATEAKETRHQVTSLQDKMLSMLSQESRDLNVVQQREQLRLEEVEKLRRETRAAVQQAEDKFSQLQREMLSQMQRELREHSGSMDAQVRREHEELRRAMQVVSLDQHSLRAQQTGSESQLVRALEARAADDQRQRALEGRVDRLAEEAGTMRRRLEDGLAKISGDVERSLELTAWNCFQGELKLWQRMKQMTGQAVPPDADAPSPLRPLVSVSIDQLGALRAGSARDAGRLGA